ncbi:MAG: hypothetical protein ACRD1E_07425, partial [Terriglobales bacterium]
MPHIIKTAATGNYYRWLANFSLGPRRSEHARGPAPINDPNPSSGLQQGDGAADQHGPLLFVDVG